MTTFAQAAAKLLRPKLTTSAGAEELLRKAREREKSREKVSRYYYRRFKARKMREAGASWVDIMAAFPEYTQMIAGLMAKEAKGTPVIVEHRGRGRPKEYRPGIICLPEGMTLNTKTRTVRRKARKSARL